MPDHPDHAALSRRQVLAAAGGAGLLAAVGTGALAEAAAAAPADGTPEQIHLTWGHDPATSVVVSWASPASAVNPRVLIGHRTVRAKLPVYTDGINGETVWTYHAHIDGLRPGKSYAYEVATDNSSATTPFSATFRTAPEGRAPFRFTSFGDLATPNTQWVLSYGQSAYAVEAVESFQPLFHLLNGDLCYADLNPTVQPEVWRDFGNNNHLVSDAGPGHRVRDRGVRRRSGLARWAHEHHRHVLPRGGRGPGQPDDGGEGGSHQ
jgi:alkaline phosphatase D